MTLETAEMKYSGLADYFQDAWNYFDSTQYITYLISIYIWINSLYDGHGLHDGDSFWLDIWSIILLLQSAMKFLQLIRYNEPFSFLVAMLGQVASDIYPFLIIYFTFYGVFTLVTLILEGSYDNDDYGEELNTLVINLIQTFRNTIGDVKEPKYEKWINKKYPLENAYQYAIITITWVFFVINIFLM